MLKYIILIFTIFMIGSSLSHRVHGLNPRYELPPQVPVPITKYLPKSERMFHETIMRELINYTKQNSALFGSLIAHKNGTIMCYGLNENAITFDNTMHGEMVAIHNCSRLYKLPKYTDYYLYTTGESCSQCQSAIMWCGFSKIIFGSSIETLYCDKCLGQILLDSNFIAAFGLGLNDNYVPPQIIQILEDVTDSEIFPSFCNTTFSWKVTPKCKPKKHHHNHHHNQ